MQQNNIAKAAIITSILSTALTADLAPINTDGLPAACFMLRLTNGGTTVVSVSFDGVNINEVVLPGDTFPLATQTNAQPPNYVNLWPKGMIVYVSGTAGTDGSVYLSAYYN